MSELVNLRLARKRKARAEAERQAAENRVRFGRAKGEVSRERHEAARAARSLDGKRLAAPFGIKGLDHVVLRYRDVAEGVRFYCEVLGCTVEKLRPAIGLTQLRAGSALIDLLDVASATGSTGGAAPGKEGRNLDHFCLRVEPWDGEAIRAHLAAHGFPAGEVASRYGADGQGPSIYLHDPEGNQVELKGPPEG